MADFIRIETNPVPAGAEVFDFAAEDGALLRGAVLPARRPKGGVVLLGGRCEFIEKYFEVARDLHERGLSVATMDWRGQGLSARLLADPLKGHIEDFAQFRADLRLFTDEIARKRLSGPLFLLTHSMGGLPALQLLADGYDGFDAAVLSAPMTRLYANPLRRRLVRALAQAATALGAGARTVPVKEHALTFEGNVLTSDPARHARFLALQKAEPRAVIRSPTFGWLKAALDAMEDIHAAGRFQALKTPVLIVSAENDRLVDSSDHRLLAGKSAFIECVAAPGSLHEILMESEPCRSAFWRAFDAFVEPRLARKGVER